MKMKNAEKSKAVMMIALAIIISACATTKVKVVELENKGTSMNVPTPEWIKLYTAGGIMKVQALSQFKGKYCIIGEESGTNKKFVLAWADEFSAQQRIGAMLRTQIDSLYHAKVDGDDKSTGGPNSTISTGEGSGKYDQEIKNTINTVVSITYSGAQRDSDWWSLRRRYDLDQKDVFSDEYTAYVMYTIPRKILDDQVAKALESAVKKDSELYQITIDIAKQILQNGLEQWGAE